MTTPNDISSDSSAASVEGLHIGISGLIGAGKTTLCTALGKVLNLPTYHYFTSRYSEVFRPAFHFEHVIENEYLADFYKDPKQYSFPLQIYLLNHRFRQQQQIIWQGRGGVQDRTIYEDSVFAKMLRDSGLMNDRDYRTYMSLFSNMSNFMRRPNLIIYLEVGPEESLERIKQRSRDMESTITLEYLTNLFNAYEQFITEISRVIPVIKVNWRKFRTAEEMAEMIKREYSKMQNVHSVEFTDPPQLTNSR